MLDWLVPTGAAVSAGSLVAATLLALFARLQGDCRIRLLPERLTLLEREAEPGRLCLRFQMPIVNAGRQKGMVVEVLPRLEYLPRLHKSVWLAIKCHLAEARSDGYWQANLMKAGQAGTLETAIQVTAPPRVLRRLIEGGTLPLVFYCKVIGRGGTVWLLQEVAVPLTPVSQSAPKPPEGAGMSGPAGASEKGESFPATSDSPTRWPGQYHSRWRV